MVEEFKYKLLFDLFNKVMTFEGAVIITDSDKKLITANQNFYETWGYDPEEILGKSAHLLYSQEIVPDTSGYLKLSESGEISLTDFNKMMCKDKNGFMFEAESFLSPLIDDQEAIIGFLGVYKKIQNNELYEERKMLGDFISCTGNWYWEINRNGIITFFKGPGKYFLGYHLKSFVGKSIFSFMRDFDSEKCREKFQKAFEEKSALKNIKACFECRDGEIRSMMVNAVPVRDLDGEIRGYRGINFDTTGQKELIKEIESLAKFPEENPNPVLRINNDGYFVYANQAGETVLKAWDTYVGGKVPKNIEKDLVYNVLKNKKPTVHEFEIDGSHFSFNAVPVLKEGYVNLYGSNIDSRIKFETDLKLNEQRYKMAQEAGNLGTWEWDKSKRVFHFSEMVPKIFGIRAAEYNGNFRTLWKKIYKNDRIKLLKFLDHLKKLHDSATIDLRIKDKSGLVRWAMLTGAVVTNPVTQKNHVAGTIQDITDRKLIEERILTLSRGVEQSPALVMFTDPEGNIQYINNRFSEVMGYKLEEIRGKNPRIFKSGVHDKDFYKNLWDELILKRNWRGEICNRSKKGQLLWFLALISPVFDSNGDLIHYLYVSEDISEKKSQQEKIAFQALHDSLTKLPNRALFRDRMIQLIERANRLKETSLIGIFFMDLDKFKPINDTLGHSAGDEVLKIIADRIEKAIRKEDTVARFGGDEFAFLIQGLPDKKQAEKLAQKILNEVLIPVTVDKKTFQLSASIGISIYPEDGRDYDTLLTKADKAMYSIKGSEKKHINFFQKSWIRSKIGI